MTKYTNRDGNRLDEQIVTSTVFQGTSSQQQFNNLTDTQYKGMNAPYLLVN